MPYPSPTSLFTVSQEDFEDEDAAQEEDDGEEDDDEAEGDLHDLVNALPAKMRQKVLSKEAYESSDDEEGGDDTEDSAGWGKKKAAYYSADTTDLEIGQDIEDAKDEEEAAMVRLILLFHPPLPWA